MNPFALHVASGNALFSGSAIAGAAVLLTWLRPGKYGLIKLILWLAALALITCSATPLHPVVWAVWGLTWLFWLMVHRSPAIPRKSLQGFATVVFVAVAITINGGELLTLRSPDVNVSGEQVFVIGDSLSVPLEKGAEDCWPDQLQRDYAWNITNLAEAGATSKSALKQAEQLSDAGGLVVLEIGGNDLFSGVSSAEFESRMRELLPKVLEHNRTAVMLELPLPPFCNEYGRVQRRLAAEYGIPLVTKRLFATVLSGRSATIDGLHLSNQGRATMARLLAETLVPKEVAARP